MPFTPLHMGPGLLVKALLQGSFSLMVFGWAQILMDIQPLIVLISGQGHLHGFTHTYLGATLVACAAAITGKFASELGLRLIGEARFIPISWPVTILSAFIGTYSHVLLDSIMHADLEPFAPFALNNPFLMLLTIDSLHLLCASSAIVGGVLYFAISAYCGTQRWPSQKRNHDSA